MELDNLSYIALNSFYTELFHSNEIDTYNRARHSRVDLSPRNQQLYKLLPLLVISKEKLAYTCTY